MISAHRLLYGSTVPLLRRKADVNVRRSPRIAAFRSRDLVNELRGPLASWLSQEGFRRLGDRGWRREHPDGHLMIAVQASQSGWDNRSGNKFVVEFEVSAMPKFATGSNRNRIWKLLSATERSEAIEIIKRIAATLPAPDEAFVAQLPTEVQPAYLRLWNPDFTPESSDVWFNYYDEDDAKTWARFLLRTIGPALDRFLTEPPSFMGFRGGQRTLET